MPEHDLEKLLGGFAANTLTPEERSQLYTASLQDQQLFNALADEQALKELLSDPAVRRKLLEALKRPNTAEAGGSLPWWAWFKRPAGLAFAGGLAAVIFALAFGTRIYQESLDRAAQSVTTEDARSKPGHRSEAPPSADSPRSPDAESQTQSKSARRTGAGSSEERCAHRHSSQARATNAAAKLPEQRAAETASDMRYAATRTR
jgi:cytoskeletal protein RodZ